MPGVRVAAPLDGPAEACAAYSPRRSADVVVVPGVTPVVDDTMSVLF